MDAFTDDKKKNNEKKPFNEDRFEDFFSNERSKDDEKLLNEKKQGCCSNIKEEIDETDREIDLFLGEQTSTKDEIHDQKIAPDTKASDTVPQQKVVREIDTVQNETSSIPSGRVVPPPLPTSGPTGHDLQVTVKKGQKVQQESKKTRGFLKMHLHKKRNRLNQVDVQKHTQHKSSDMPTSSTIASYKETLTSSVAPAQNASNSKSALHSEFENRSDHKLTTADTVPWQPNASQLTFKENDTADVPQTKPWEKTGGNISFNGSQVPFRQQETPLDEDVRKFLVMTDELLGKLPEEVIADFATSEGFILYEKIMKKYHIK